MAISIQKKEFSALLRKVLPVIPVKSSLQILSNFRLSFNDPYLGISATDLDHSMRVLRQASGNAPFDIIVNARKILKIVRELPDGEVLLDIDKNVLIMQSPGGFSCKIPGADSSDFPEFPEIPSGFEFEISAASLKEMITKTSFAVAKDETHACLHGILWEIFPDKTGMVASDGFRLSRSFIAANFSLSDKISGIIPPKSLQNLARAIDQKGPEERVRVFMGEKHISFNTSTLTMYSKLIDGPYPDYTKAIPRNNPKQVIVERNTLQSAIRRVSVLSNQKTHPVEFTFSTNNLAIIALNCDIYGVIRENISVEYEGDTHAIGFNGQYFSEILGIIKTQKIRMEMNTRTSACLIVPYSNKQDEIRSDDLFLIMPRTIEKEA